MAFDAFLKIEGIPGESTDDKHKEWIEILSYSHSASQQTSGSASSGGARASGRIDVSDFSIVKGLDKASPKIFQALCRADNLATITLELCRATGDKQKYYQIIMTDCIISSYSPGGSGEGEETLPVEEVSFNYGKIELTYTETDTRTGKAKGDIMASYDAVSMTVA